MIPEWSKQNDLDAYDLVLAAFHFHIYKEQSLAFYIIFILNIANKHATGTIFFIIAKVFMPEIEQKSLQRDLKIM